MHGVMGIQTNAICSSEPPCCLRLKDPLVGYLLHFVEEEFHIFLGANLKESIHPQVIFWYLMTLKVEQGVIPLEVLYSQFGIRIQKVPKQRHWYEVRTIVGSRILAKGDHGFCQKSITVSENACLGVNHYLVPAYVEHEKFLKKNPSYLMSCTFITMLLGEPTEET